MPTIAERVHAVAEDLRRIFRARGVTLAYLFGSVARGRERADSDLDLAVLLPRGVPPSDRLQAAMDINWDVVTLMHIDDVDVVVLNDAPPVLAREIAITGKRLHGTPADDLAFRLDALKRFMDTEPLRRVTRRALHARLDRLAAALPPGRNPW